MKVARPSIYRSMPDSAALVRLHETLTVFTSEDVHKDLDVASLADFLVDTTSMMVLPISSSQNLYAIAVQNHQQHRFYIHRNRIGAHDWLPGCHRSRKCGTFSNLQ